MATIKKMKVAAFGVFKLKACIHNIFSLKLNLQAFILSYGYGCRNFISMQKIYTLLFLLFSAYGFSQNVTLKGKVTGPDAFPLESATVYVTSVKDSSVIDYTITAKNGTWELKTRTSGEPVNLKISYVGFADYRQQLEAITADKDFGTLALADRATTLNEVIIESEVPPIRIKKDTLEFNASSFKVRPDANVETLLKQLPGVDVDSDGTITVNGKEVNQILVNGKAFFDADGKIALKNLPADIINKVQVSDTKSKEEELLKKRASSNNASINLTIDEKKNKGTFGKIMGGYGTNDRYESSAMINNFKGKRRISILASANNINSTGFSMDEIFDSMGGGRNTAGGLGSAVRQAGSGSGQGITQSNMIGGSYNDEWFKNFSSNINYFYNSANTANENRTRETTFLPRTNGSSEERSLTTTSSSKTDNSRFVHNANTEFEWKIDSTATLIMQPKFTAGTSTQKSATVQSTVDQDGDRSNQSENNTFNNTDNRSFTNSIQYRKRLNVKGRLLSAVFNNNNNADDTSTRNRQSTIFYEEDGLTERNRDFRNQIRYNNQSSDQYTGSLEYLEPVADSLRIKVKANYNSNQNTQNRKGFDYDEASGEYSILNDSLTNYLVSHTQTFTPTAGFDLNLEKYDLSGDFGQKITQYDNSSFYLGNNYSIAKQYILPYASVHGGLHFTKSTSLRVNYNYNTSLPSATQILPVDDVSNPLNTIRGNPDLDPNKSHNVNVNFRDFDYATRSGYNIYANGRYNDSQIVSYAIIDAITAKRLTSYQNISGAYDFSLGGNWNKTIKRGEHSLRLTAGLNTSYNLQKGFTNQQMYQARSITLIPRLNINYDYGDLLTVAPNYSYTYNQSNYTNYRINQASNYIHRISLVTTSYWPKNVVFGNDLNYTYNSLSNFKKDFYLWNMSLGYNFLNDHLMFKVKVYDVLNQNLGTSRTIGATSIKDEENIVLKRYAMFSLTYSLKQFGPAKKPARGGSRSARP